MNNQNTSLLTMTSSPHVKSPTKTKNIMADVIIALIPALVWSVYIFGIRSLSITLVSVLSCNVFEYLYRKIMKKSFSLSDLSATVTGILLAFCLPVSIPLWMPALGAFFAIVIVKQLYGGIGKNVVNPALAGRVFLFIAFPAEMATFTQPGKFPSFFKVDITSKVSDIVAGATPLASLKDGTHTQYSAISAFFGNIPGTIGEISASLLIIGGIYLIFKKVISWHIPVSFLATVAVISFVFPVGNYSRAEFMLLELFSGGVMLGAFFMATDYVTSPVTKFGRIIFGVGCGLITMFIRYFGEYPEGVSFAILIMNLFVWYIDKATKPKVFGGKKKNEAKQ